MNDQDNDCMKNWNYDKAVAFVASIPDPISKTLTKLFLDRLTFFVSQKEGYPAGEFDLLFFVQVVADVSKNAQLFQKILDGGGDRSRMVCNH
jgi:hypothetical protein